jgi:hypothetical protein
VSALLSLLLHSLQHHHGLLNPLQQQQQLQDRCCGPQAVLMLNLTPHRLLLSSAGQQLPFLLSH